MIESFFLAWSRTEPYPNVRHVLEFQHLKQMT